MRAAGFQARSDISGPNASVPETFAQLRHDLANATFVNTLGKLAVDDPARLDKLTLSNLRENKRAQQPYFIKFCPLMPIRVASVWSSEVIC